MRIGLVTEYFHPDDTGGTPVVLSDLARRLSERFDDLEIDVVTSRNLYRGEAADLAAREIWNGVRIIRLKAPKSNRRSTAMRLAAGLLFSMAATMKLLVSPRYDLLFVGTNPPTAPIAARVMKRLRGTPYLYLIHDLYPDLATALGMIGPRHPVSRVLGAFQRSWLHGSSLTVVVGRCMRSHLVSKYGLPEERIEVIPNGSDPDRIVPLGKETRFRSAHGLSGVLVLYAGNFGQYQNFDAILDASRRLSVTDPDVTFVFVGEGARKEAIVRRIEDERLTNVRLYPFVPEDEFADLLASADLSLVTLEPGAEGLGVPSKFYHILASGRPTVAIVDRSSEIALVLAEEECGVSIEHGDADRLADLLSELAGDPDRRDRMGRNARFALESRFSLQLAADRYYRAFHAAVGTPPDTESAGQETSKCAT